MKVTLKLKNMAKSEEKTITLTDSQRSKALYVTVERSTSEGWFQEERHLIAIDLTVIYQEVAPPVKVELARRAEELIEKKVLIRGIYAVVVPTENDQIISEMKFKVIIEDDDDNTLAEVPMEDSNDSGLYEFDCKLRFQ